ncbi:MAG: hypothetical protein F6K41_24055 [Symploca sp. SIO3E6]|nr:hypothetical protein [Caldora sp. SIO3E6]
MDVLEPDAVILVDRGQTRFGERMITVSDLTTRIEGDIASGLNTTGVDCQILSPGKPWRKGKIKTVVIFEEVEEVTNERVAQT